VGALPARLRQNAHAEFLARPHRSASKLPYPPASPEYVNGEAQRKAESLAIASYLVDKSERTRDAAQSEGERKTADRGGQRLTATSTAPAPTRESSISIRYDAEAATPPPKRTCRPPGRDRERDVAPTLATSAAKMNQDWLTLLVENPSRYWHGTRMPNLRLSRVEGGQRGAVPPQRLKDERRTPPSDRSGRPRFGHSVRTRPSATKK